MIKAGKTFTEIQNELKKVVAARDEAELEKSRRTTRIAAARSKAVSALQEYFSAIDIPMDSEEDTKAILDIFYTIESSLTPGYKKLFEIKTVKPTSSSSIDEPVDDFVKWIRKFID